MPDTPKNLHNKILGRQGEKLTRRYLRRHRYAIVARNYVTPFGEADIIAKKGDLYCFVEVKLRAGDALALPAQAVDAEKQRRYRNMARYFCASMGEEVPIRFDVASILNGTLEYYEDAFR